jgi:hypothetical protein
VSVGLATSPQTSKGIIPEDDPWLRWNTFATRDIGGGYNHALLEAAQGVLPEIRLGPVPGGMQWPLWLPGQYPPHHFGAGGFNCLWYYYYLNYWQPLVGTLYWDEIARMNNRELPLVVTAGMAGEDEPTYYRNKFFLHMAGGVQGFNYFTYGEGERRPRGLAEIGRLGTGIVRSYYPLLGRLRPSRHAVGLLLPHTHVIHDNDYTARVIYAYANLLAAHVDVEPTCEEELISGDANRYRVILLHGVKWLRQKAYDALTKYARDTGTVLLDASTALEIPGSRRLGVDLAMGPNRTRSAGGKPSFDYPWLHDYLLPERVAAVRVAVSRFVRPEIDSSSIELVCRQAEADGIRYLWLVHVHSHEDYEYLRPRIGAGSRPDHPQQARREAIAYLDAKDREHSGRFTATVRIPSGYVPYDVLRGQQIHAQPIDDGVQFSASMPCLGGQLVALYRRRIAAVKIETPAKVAPGNQIQVKVVVQGDDGRPMPGSQPLHVEISQAGRPFSEWTGSYVTTHGALEFPLHPAMNHPRGDWQIAVRELSSGHESRRKLCVADR